MNYMKKYINAVLLLFIATSLSSCLKNEYDALNPDGSPSVVEFKNPGAISSASPAGSLYSVYPQAFALGASVNVTYTVQLSGANPASQDVTVTIGADPDAVTRFNNDQKSKNPNFVNFDLLDANLYSFPKTTYVIPAGQRSVNVVVAYNSAAFSFKKKYAFPLAIKTTNFGSVSSNFGTILMNVSGKNPYDGIYAYKTSANTALLPNRSLNVNMLTSGATSLDIAPGLLANYTNQVTYTIDPVTNAVSVDCPSLVTVLPQDTRSKYDPATKTMTVYWKSNGGSRIFEETFVYVGPRP